MKWDDFPVVTAEDEKEAEWDDFPVVGSTAEERPFDPPTMGDKLANAGRAVYREGVGGVGDLLSGVAVAAKRLDESLPEGIQSYQGKNAGDLATGVAGKSIREWAEENWQADPRLQDAFWSNTVPGALGSSLPMLAGGLPAAGSKAALGGVGALGALQSGGAANQQALEMGMTPEEAQVYAEIMGMVGVSEALPLNRIVGRLPLPIKGKLASHFLREMAVEGGEEFIQEFGQGASGKAFMEWMQGNEQELPKAFWDAAQDPNTWEGAFAGLVVGGAIGGAKATLDSGQQSTDTARDIEPDIETLAEIVAAQDPEAQAEPEVLESADLPTEPERTTIITPETFAADNPEAATLLAQKEKPSRKDFREAGLQDMPAAERAQFAAGIREALTREQAPEAIGEISPRPTEQPVQTESQDAAPVAGGSQAIEESLAVPEPAVEPDPLAAMKAPELRARAKELGLKGYVGKKNDVVRQMIREAESQKGAPDERNEAETDQEGQGREGVLNDGGVAEDVAPPSVPPDAPDARMATAPDALAPSSGVDILPFPTSEQDVGTDEAPIADTTIIKTLEKRFAVPIRKGRVTVGGAAGIYKADPRVVRMRGKYGGNIAVAAHEVAHHVDVSEGLIHPSLDKHKIPDRYLQELKDLDYDPAMQRPHEGFAEFIRHYLTDPQKARTVAPQFYQWWTSYLQKNPELGLKFAQARTEVKRWADQGGQKRVEAKISRDRKPPKPEGVTKREYARELMSEIVEKGNYHLYDEGGYLQKAVEKAKTLGFDAEPGSSAYEIYLALSQTGPTLAMDAIENGVFSMGKSGRKKIGKSSLRDALTGLDKERYEKFTRFLYANHAVEVHEKGMNPGISLKDATQVRDELLAENPDFADRAKTVTDFNNALLDMMAEDDVGVISKESAERMKAAWETYVPLLRVQEGWLRRRLSGRRLVDLGPEIKRRRGSALPIIDPIESTIERAILFYERASKQLVVNAFVDMVENTKGMGETAEWVAPIQKKTSFSLDEIKGQLKDAGVDPQILQGLDPEESLYIWRPDYMAKGASEPIVRVNRGGETRLYHMDPNLANSINGMSFFQLPWLIEVTLGAAKRGVQLGATALNPEFAIPNFARDYVAFLVQRKESSGAKTALDPFSMIGRYVAYKAGHVAGKDGDPLIRYYIENGGELTHFLGLDQKRIQATVQELTADTASRRALSIVKHPVEALKTAVGVTEVGPRLAEFKAALAKRGFTEEGMRNGDMPDRAALIYAANAAADVTVNFKRMGKSAKYAGRLVPYLTAALAGQNKVYRTIRRGDRRTFLRLAALSAASAAYWFSVKDDDWYKEAPPWLRYGFWTLTDADGNPVLRIPRPFDYGWLVSAFTEATLDGFYQHDPKAMGEWMKEGRALVPPLGVTAAQVPVESYFNWDFFRGRKIVSESLERKLPKDQYYAYNSYLARKIGEALNLSPAKIDHVANGLTGGTIERLSRWGEGAATGFEGYSFGELPIVGRFGYRTDYTMAVDEFYRVREQTNKEYNSANATPEGPTDELRDRRNEFEGYSDLMSSIRDEMKKATDAKGKLSREERMKFERYLTGLGRFALDKEELDRYPNPLSDTRLPAEIKTVVDEFLGKLLYRATAPKPMRQTGENIETYRQRVSEWEASTNRAKAIAEKIGLSNDRKRALLQAEVKRRDHSGDVLVERRGRLD